MSIHGKKSGHGGAKKSASVAVMKSPAVAVKPKPGRPSDRITRDGNGKINIPLAAFDDIARAFVGVANDRGGFNERVSVLFGQTVLALPLAGGDAQKPEALNFALDATGSLGPRDGLEAMLCSQMVAVHSQAMEFMRRAVASNQSSEGTDRNVNRATRLLRTFAQLVDTLRAKRSAGKQRMVIKHVHVNQGGQAIIGNVGRGVGDAKEKHE